MFRVDENKIFIYDVIGPSSWGYIGSEDIYDALKDIGKNEKVIVHLNSPGGGVDEGVGIYNLLKSHSGGVEVVVDSLAASIASVIAMAGSRITMTKGSRMMIHEPWTMAVGNAKSLRKQADVLDIYQSSILSIYQQRAKPSKEEIVSMLEAETWLDPDEAVRLGFADGVDGDAVESPQVPKNTFKNVPQDVAQVKLEKPKHNHRDYAKIMSEVIRLRTR